MNLRPDGPLYCGGLYEPTPAGFQRLLGEANEAARIGYDLIVVERVGSQLGVVFRKRVRSTPSVERPALLGE